MPALHNRWPPRVSQSLHDWLREGQQCKDGLNLEANIFEMDVDTRRPVLSMNAVFILQVIMYSHNLPLETVLMLWSSFYGLIMHPLFRIAISFWLQNFGTKFSS